MSAVESTSKQECEPIESACAAELVMKKPVKDAKSSKNLVINQEISIKKFVEMLRSLHSIITQEGCLSKKQNNMIKMVKSKMDQLYRDIISSKNPNINNLVFLAQVYLYLSYIYSNNKNDLQLDIANDRDDSQLDIVDFYVKRCIDLLEGKETESKVILTAIDAYYFLGCQYIKQKNVKQSVITFEKALQLYLTYNEDRKEYVAPTNIVSSFVFDKLSSDPEYLLEKRCTMILQKLLVRNETEETDDISNQIIDKIAVYKHKLLKRILNKILPSEDYVKWALQLTFLAEIFIQFERFTAVKYYLAAASFMMEKYYQEKYIKIKKKVHPDEKASILNVYQEIVADIDRHWAGYGVQLLQSSHKKLLPDVKDKHCKICDIQVAVNKSDESLEFVDITQDLKEFTVKITDKYFSCYTDAKTISMTVLKHCSKAKKYFTPEQNLLKYVDIMQKTAWTYKYLTIYEKNENEQIKLHKLRLKVLEQIKAVLETKNEKSSITSKILIEIAIANSDIMNMYTKNIRYNNAILSEPEIRSVSNYINEILLFLQLYQDMTL